MQKQILGIMSSRVRFIQNDKIEAIHYKEYSLWKLSNQVRQEILITFPS